MGILILLYQFAFFIQQTGKILQWKDSGTLKVTFNTTPEEGPWAITEVDNPEFVSGSRIAVGDSVLAIINSQGTEISRNEFFSIGPIILFLNLGPWLLLVQPGGSLSHREEDFGYNQTMEFVPTWR